MEKYFNPDASIKYTDSLEGILNTAESNGQTVIRLLPKPHSIYNSSSRGGGDKRPASNHSHIKGKYQQRNQQSHERVPLR